MHGTVAGDLFLELGSGRFAGASEMAPRVIEYSLGTVVRSTEQRAVLGPIMASTSGCVPNQATCGMCGQAIRAASRAASAGANATPSSSFTSTATAAIMTPGVLIRLASRCRTFIRTHAAELITQCPAIQRASV
jgi:hypothetical protein